MDTIETNAPETVDVNPVEDTAAQVDTQPTDQETVTDNDTQKDAGETLYAGKYKSPQELEKAYLEAQKAIGQVSSKAEIANILEERTGMTADQIRDYIRQQEEVAQQQRIQQDPGGYALQEVEHLKGQLALQQEQRELETFIAENPSYAPFKEKIFNLGLNLETDKPYAEIAQDYFGQAIAQGQQSAYEKIDVKRNTQPTGVQSQPQQQITADDMRQMSSAELEKLLPHADTSNRII